MLKLRPPAVIFLFVLGAAAGLVGDHAHVVTRTTTYLSSATRAPPHAVPLIGSPPLWSPAPVGGAPASRAGRRLPLPRRRTDVTPRQGLAGVAAVIGTYVVTALIHAAP